MVVFHNGQGILKGYHCTIDVLFDWFGLVFLQIKTKIVSSHTDDSKPVKPKVNGTVILPPLVFPAAVMKLVNINDILKIKIKMTFAKVSCHT